MKQRITLISDTHTKHFLLNLPGGDTLIFGGDLMNTGYSLYEIQDFVDWISEQNYKNIIFIAGNHDRAFENKKDVVDDILSNYKNVAYLQDSSSFISNENEEVLVYGSPWQPEFYNWAFNLPRRGKELEKRWSDIPEETKILITHGPPQGHLDISGPPYNQGDLGCELLRVRVDEIKPNIHIFGHIHGSYGYKYHNGTHFFNASVLNEKYEVVNKPITFDWDSITNRIDFI